MLEFKPMRVYAMLRKSHIMSFVDHTKKRVNTTFKAIIWPQGVKVYVTVTIKGKLKDDSKDYDIYRLASDHLDYVCETYDALPMPRTASALGLTLTFTHTEGK